jgi:hypothetical protein
MFPDHTLEYSVSLSFYHSTSKRFFGSTWMGNRNSDSAIKKDTLLANEVRSDEE